MNSRATLRAVSRPLFAAAVVIAFTGCAPTASEEPASSAAPSGEPEISLGLADADRYEKALVKSRGKVILVDFWATWCQPCVEQFPHTVELHRKFQDRGLAVVSVSMDAPGEVRSVLDFLVEREAHFENLLSKYESPVEAIEEFGLPGPIPCYRVYDREGKLRHEFALNPRAKKQFTPADIEAAVEALL